jgi:hypothetical protein
MCQGPSGPTSCCPAGEVVSPDGSTCVYDLADYVMPSCSTAAAWNTIRDNGKANFWRFVPIGGDPTLGAHFIYVKSPDGWDFEEYYIDKTAIRLVKDTSWAYQDPPDSGTWCDEQCGSTGAPTSCQSKHSLPWVVNFAYMAPTDASNTTLGAERLPRYFDPNKSGASTTMINIVGKSQAACGSCDSWHSAPQQQVSFTVSHRASVVDTGNGTTYNDVFELDITDGPGKGETTYYARGVGWLGFVSGSASEWITTSASGTTMPVAGCTNPGAMNSYCSYL